MSDIVAELDAKAWQATRRDKYREDHVCYRAAREIERLRYYLRQNLGVPAEGIINDLERHPNTNR